MKYNLTYFYRRLKKKLHNNFFLISQGTVASDCGDLLISSSNELTSLKHEIQLLRERLDQQSQQTRAAVAHARLLQDQLAAETTARVEAQVYHH